VIFVLIMRNLPDARVIRWVEFETGLDYLLKGNAANDVGGKSSANILKSEGGTFILEFWSFDFVNKSCQKTRRKLIPGGDEANGLPWNVFGACQRIIH